MAATITNNKFTNRVIDLAGANPNGNFIGWIPNGGASQKWVPIVVGGNTIYANMGVAGVFAMVNPLVSGGVLRGGRVGTPFVQAAVDDDPNVVRISAQDADGTELFWTLTAGAPGAQIQLLPATGNADQVWTLAQS